MPIGCYAMVPSLAHHLCLHRPARVLDLGMGSGGNGCAVRQWLDLGVRPWKTYLVGVEVWAEYRNPMWDLYNLIVVDTIENYLNNLTETFDCVLLTDVIEHFCKPDGRQLLKRLRNAVAPRGQLLVGTPAKFFAQGPVYGNRYEEHRSAWSRGDFEDLGFEVTIVGQPDYFCGQALMGVWQNAQSHSPGSVRLGDD